MTQVSTELELFSYKFTYHWTVCSTWLLDKTVLMLREQVLRVSSTTGEGLPELWEKMKEFRIKLTLSGDLERRREKQHVRWMDNHINDKMRILFFEHPAVQKLVPKLEFLVEKGAVTPGYAADILLQQFSSSVQISENVQTSELTEELLEAERQFREWCI